MGELLNQDGSTLLSQAGGALLSQADAGAAAELPLLRITWPQNNGGSYDLVTVKVGDTMAWGDVIKFAGSVVDLTDAASVSLLVRSRTSGETTELTGEVVDAEAGSVKYQPLDGDVAAADRLALNWRVTFNDGRKLTYPSRGHVYMEVEA